MSPIYPLLLTTLLLAGCQSNLPFTSQPGPKDAPWLMMTLEDQRRLTLATDNTQQLCIDPPSEATELLSRLLTRQLQTEPADGISADTAALTLEPFYQRAHSLQLFRDAAYFLCVNALGQAAPTAADRQAYSDAVLQLIEQLKAPLTEEIRLYYQLQHNLMRKPATTTEVIICAPESSEARAPKGCQRMRLPNRLSPPVTTPAPPSRPIM